MGKTAAEVATRKPATFAECMDIFDWFDDPTYGYLNHISLSKMDADTRIARAMPSLIEHAATLLAKHAGTENAYPSEPLCMPA